MKVNLEKGMCRNISTRQDQNCILMKEKVEKTPYTVMKFEEEESVLFKSMIIEYNSVIDGMELMLCSDQHKKRMPKEISIGTSESHVFETNYWCMSAGIEAHLNDLSMQVVKHRMDTLRKKGKIRIGPLTEEYVHYCKGEYKITLEKNGAGEGLAESLVNSWESSD